MDVCVKEILAATYGVETGGDGSGSRAFGAARSLLCHARHFSHDLLAGFDIVLARNRNGLHSRRSAAVERAEAGDSPLGRAGQVAYMAPELRLILRRHVVASGGVFFGQIRRLRVDEFFFMRKGGRNSPGNVGQHFHLVEDGLAGETSTHIAINGMGDITARTIGDKALPGYEYFRL